MSRRQLERGTALRGMVSPEGIVPLGADFPPDGSGPDADCDILHLDMDAFFASVEQLRHPETRGRPVVIGGTGPRSVVAAANYAARAKGVHSAMPMAQALRLCPDAAVFPPDGPAYRRVSESVMEILRSVTPLVQPLSLDEAFLDVSGARRRLGGPVRIAARIRERVRQEQGLTCSVGVAATRFTAKLGSTHCKPDGLLLVPTASVRAFLDPLPVGALPGVGDKTERVLARMGLRTVGALARYDADLLRLELGDKAGTRLSELARGIDESPVEPESADKSIGTEETFDEDVSDPETVRRELLRLSEKVGHRLRASGQAGRTVSVKLRRGDFSTVTRSRTLPDATDVGREINAVARELYAASGLVGVPLRLVGVRVEGVLPADRVHRQMALGEEDSGWRDVERVMDRVRERFGPGAIQSAVLAKRDERDV
ncbi:DNA polymerase IV [Nocardiopsis algeriensis]|uniref:DNA polymerase IV n=1 Tax=Nocardiopsis algeriensis TaxID=1478215 RepID=A0A841IT23_9ACTN|nr:DNA polymerase IV [Nocardiopsis algeriensis]MBB6121454.1 DNA polymerase-4 [Nocardiopsis algeriensis]